MTKELDKRMIAHELEVQKHIASAQEKMRKGSCFTAAQELRLAAKALERVGDTRALLKDVLKRA